MPDDLSRGRRPLQWVHFSRCFLGRACIWLWSSQDQAVIRLMLDSWPLVAIQGPAATSLGRLQYSLLAPFINQSIEQPFPSRTTAPKLNGSAAEAG